ncbi:multidrug effflux MFS transporter [Pseudohoeflea coraliihabitans]|uniref:Multidrug effflux MFS transporter n=1 Tax=Pseudohoeflea coraliihabitans TaxID=2860393 RepID=A0ABS6WS99_9HYPH|nr:multidrug effflux MFS transporter [Pseudohoeflea sp. DP4N28-3]MBW3098829.1 multidrug effflux MFS transporter [Pseudohoeflea sp. DP4N28-3]
MSKAHPPAGRSSPAASSAMAAQAPGSAATPYPGRISGFGEFIAIMAMLTSIVAFSIDIILPALPEIGTDYRLADANDQQLVIVVFTITFGLVQLLFGPLADRYGRKALMVGSLLFYAGASLAASFAPSFEMLLAARMGQAIGAAGVRVTTSAVIRDCFLGRDMARVMSYIFTTFMIVPIFAPAVGQMIMTLAEWHFIFTFLGVISAGLALWTMSRLAETLDPADRRPLSFATVAAATVEIATNRVAAGYSVASTLMFGALFSMIVSVQQIFDLIYGLGDWFALAFAGSAVGMAAASFVNGRVVRTVGMRRMSHGAMVTFVLAAAGLFVASLFGTPPFPLAYILLAIAMASFGLVAGNFNSIAMEPLGHIAGTASSVIGTLTFTGGAVLGAIVGQMFDGTIGPLASAFFGFGSLSLLTVVMTEGGRLFNVETAV